MNPRIEQCRFQGASGIRLAAGETEATFLPQVGMTGVSLRHRGREFLATPGGVAGLLKRSTAGLPLLAPWANRLSSWGYSVGATRVDLRGSSVPTHDDHGLPIHGLLLDSTEWSIDAQRTSRGRAVLEASMDVDMPEFPFRHRLALKLVLGDEHLDVTTTITPTGPESVPVSFGWHPYLRLQGAPRSRWKMALPARDHLELDDRGIPTGRASYESSEAGPIGRRTFDDLYALRRGRRLGIESEDGAALEVRCGDGYDYFQVWVPPGRPFVALEPMVAPTNALIEGTTPLVGKGDSYPALFRLQLRSS